GFSNFQAPCNYWHKLAQIGTNWHKLTHIGTNWHRLAQIDAYWHKLAQIGTNFRFLRSFVRVLFVICSGTARGCVLKMVFWGTILEENCRNTRIKRVFKGCTGAFLAFLEPFLPDYGKP